MANNKYTGNSSAYGFGKVMDEMDHRWDLGSQGQIGNTAPPPWMTMKAGEGMPTNTAWQQESEALKKGSAQQNPNSSIIGVNASEQANKALTGDPTTLGATLGSPMQAPMDQRRRPYEYNVPNTAAGSGGLYSLPDVSVTPDEKPWYGSLPSGEGSGYDPSKPKPMPYDPNSNQRMMNTQYAQHKGRQLDQARDAAGRNISGEGSYYHAGSDKLYDQEKRDFEARQLDMMSSGTNMQDATNIDAYGFPDSPSNDPYQPKWGKEKVDLDKFASYGSKKRYSNEQVAENLAMDKMARRDEWKEVVESEYGAPDPNFTPGMSTERELHLQALKGPDTSKAVYQDKRTADDWFKQSGIDMDIGDPLAGTGASPGFSESGSMVDYVPKSLADKTLASKVTEGIGKAGDVFEKAAPTITALATVGGTISQMSARSDVIGDLRDSVKQTEGMIGSLANTEHAEESAMLDEYTEGNRRIGEGRNLALGNRLDAVKGSNITSGTVKRIKKDLTQDFHRSTDLSLAAAADTYEKKRDQYTAESRETRAKANEELKKLRDQLKEQERQQAMAPYSMVADLAIAAVGVANPLVGMGLSAMKNKAMS